MQTEIKNCPLLNEAETYQCKYPKSDLKYAFMDGADWQLKHNKTVIQNIVVVMERLLKEARQNSFNLDHNLNDTPTEEIAQNLINELKKY